MQINKDYVLGDNEGDARTAQNYYVILHESGNANDCNDPNAILHEVQYMRNNYNNAYVTHFVGGGGQVYQIGEPGYVSWGALSANPYAPAQIELAETNDPETFKKDYVAYVTLARDLANQYGIPLTLDAGGAGTPGIKSHQWVTNNYDGDHVDPYPYFSKHGITQEQLAHDLANGIAEQTDTINNVITVDVGSDGVSTVLFNKTDPLDTTWCSHGSSWKSFGIIGDKLNRPMFKVAEDIYIPQRCTTLKNIVQINYAAGYGVNAVDKKGKELPGTNSKFKAGTKWATEDKLYNLPKVGLAYKVSTNEYIAVKYQVGSGFQG
ncbi:peptidoglycan recognition protein family protein [Bombilactobacillus folatiphilus]|uniref:Peptidoglycan recognition protein family protein n=1 Tax=Bombilactobacillus folatiphilus TaxID=2923362 RepID=A0ABY4PA45_9LACO|nr:peptidoglycan recognition family protein [Bombilactobacillus folatiphilus]UQS82618.1 peptidoglycan recognition protein family protein [Bombilactobacillus folatiphilus]